MTQRSSSSAHPHLWGPPRPRPFTTRLYTVRCRLCRLAWVLACLLLASTVAAQSVDVTTVAVSGDNVVRTRADSTKTLAENGAQTRHIQYDPFGLVATFVQGDRLWTVPEPNGAPTVFAANVSPVLPPAFTPDGLSMLYTTPDPNAPASDDLNSLRLIRRAVAGGDEQPVTTLGVVGGCALAPQGDAYSRVLLTERGGTGSPAVLFEAFGLIYHSRTCDGQGLVQVDPLTGAATVVDAFLTDLALSPDNTQVVGYDETQTVPSVVIVDLLDNTVQSTPIEGTLSALTWAPDGGIYMANGTSIFRYSVQSGAFNEVHTAPVDGVIARMRGAGGFLYYSVVPLAPDGPAPAAGTPDDAARFESLQPDVYRVPFGGDTAVFVRPDAAQFAVKPGF